MAEFAILIGKAAWVDFFYSQRVEWFAKDMGPPTPVQKNPKRKET
jgi:hypothetical protein